MKAFCSKIKEQTNRRAILTDSYLCVLGTTNVYAIGINFLVVSLLSHFLKVTISFAGDCGTVEQQRLLTKFVELFDEADENKVDILTKTMYCI